LFYTGGAPEALERGTWRAFASAASFTARMAAAVARVRCDAIVAHWLAPSALACLPNRLPLLAIAHGGDVHLLHRLHLLGPALRLLRRRGARLAFASSELRELARAAAPIDDAIVQPMGIDLARFTRITRAPAMPRRIVVAARLVPVKGVDVAIAALAHLREPAELVIAGDGPARAELAARAPSNVTFLGRVDAIDPLLREASCVVVPSRVLPNGRSEGTPMIALEAIAAGVPVIASAVGGLRDLPAVLVPPDDPHALARAIDQIDASSVVDTAAYDWSVVARRLLDHARFDWRAA
ncbi:MAG TPA: glycosyltransferase family 4 protein, partial [Kofleriaceae bacterium]|nr:glycosyltransferase family 4 protein [Kofleriaceae bacterium]